MRFLLRPRVRAAWSQNAEFVASFSDGFVHADGQLRHVDFRPTAERHHRHPATIFMNAIDVDLVGADHPVDMNEALLPPLAASNFVWRGSSPPTAHLSSTGWKGDVAEAFSSNSVL